MAGNIEIGVKVVVEEMRNLEEIVEQASAVAEAVERVKAAADIGKISFDSASFQELIAFVNSLKESIASLKEVVNRTSKIELEINADLTQVKKQLENILNEALSKIYLSTLASKGSSYGKGATGGGEAGAKAVAKMAEETKVSAKAAEEASKEMAERISDVLAEVRTMALVFREDMPAASSLKLEEMRREMASLSAKGLTEYINQIQELNKLRIDAEKSLVRSEDALGARSESGTSLAADGPDIVLSAKILDEYNAKLKQVQNIEEAIAKGRKDSISPLEQSLQLTYDMIYANENQVKVRTKNEALNNRVLHGLREISAEFTEALKTGDVSEVQRVTDSWGRVYQQFVRLDKEIVEQQAMLEAERAKLLQQIEQNERLATETTDTTEIAQYRVANTEMQKRIKQIAEVRKANDAMRESTQQNAYALRSSLESLRGYRESLKVQSARIQGSIRDYENLRYSMNIASNSAKEIIARFNDQNRVFSAADSDRLNAVYKDLAKNIQGAEQAIQSLNERQARMIADYQRQLEGRTGEFLGLDDSSARELLKQRTDALDLETNKRLNELQEKRNELIKQQIALSQSAAAFESKDVLTNEKNFSRLDQTLIDTRNQVDSFRQRWRQAQSDLKAGRNLIAATEDLHQMGNESRNLRRNLDNLVSMYDRLEKDTGKLTEVQRRNRLEAKAMSSEIRNVANSLQRARPELNRVGEEAVRAGQNFKLYNNELVSSIRNNLRFVHAMGLIGSAMMALRRGFQELIAESAAIARVMTVARSEYMGFDETAKAVTTTVRKLAIEFGEASEQVAEIVKQFGSAGLEIEEAIAGARPALELITATAANAEETTRSMAGIYNVFKDELSSTGNEMEAMAIIADVMASAYRNHQMELDEMTQGLRFAAATGRTAGFTFQELTAFLAVLNDNLIKSGTAGRTLQRVFQQFTARPEEIAQAFGVELDQSAQLSDQFLDIMRHINVEMRAGATSAGELRDSFQIFGARGARAFEALAQNMDEVDAALREMNYEAAGVSNRLSEMTKDSLARRWEAMKQALLEFVRVGLEPTTKVLKIFTDQVIKIQEILEMFYLDKIVSNFVVWGGAIGIVVQSFLAVTKIMGGFVGILITSKNRIASEMSALYGSIRARVTSTRAIDADTAARLKNIAAMKGMEAIHAANETKLSRDVATQIPAMHPARGLSSIRGLGASILAITGGWATIITGLGVGLYVVLTRYTNIFRTARDVRRELDASRAKIAEWRDETRELTQLRDTLDEIRDSFGKMDTTSRKLASSFREMVRTAKLPAGVKHQLLTLDDEELVRNVNDYYGVARDAIDRENAKIAEKVREESVQEAKLAAEEFWREFLKSDIGKSVRGHSAIYPVQFDIRHVIKDFDNLEATMSRLRDNLIKSIDIDQIEIDLANSLNSLKDRLAGTGLGQEETLEQLREFVHDSLKEIHHLRDGFTEGSEGFRVAVELYEQMFENIFRIADREFTTGLSPEKLFPVGIPDGLAREYDALGKLLGTPVPVKIFDEMVDETEWVREELETAGDIVSRIGRAYGTSFEEALAEIGDIKLEGLRLHLDPSAIVEEFTRTYQRSGGPKIAGDIVEYVQRRFDEYGADLDVVFSVDRAALESLSEAGYNFNNDVDSLVASVERMDDVSPVVMASLRALSDLMLDGIPTTWGKRAVGELMRARFELSKLDDTTRINLADTMERLGIGSEELINSVRDVNSEVSAIDLEEAFEVSGVIDGLNRVKVDMIDLLHLSRGFLESGGKMGQFLPAMLANLSARTETYVMNLLRATRIQRTYIDTISMSLIAAREQNALFSMELQKTAKTQELAMLDLARGSRFAESSLEDLHKKMVDFQFTSMPSNKELEQMSDEQVKRIEEERKAELETFNELKKAYELKLDIIDIERQQLKYVKEHTNELAKQRIELANVQRNLQGSVSIVLERYRVIEQETKSLVEILNLERQLVRARELQLGHIESEYRMHERNLEGLTKIVTAYKELSEVRQELLDALREEEDTVISTLSTIEEILHPTREYAGIRYDMIGWTRQIFHLEQNRLRVTDLLQKRIITEAQHRSEMIKSGTELVNIYKDIGKLVEDINKAELAINKTVDKRVSIYGKLSEHLSEQSGEFETAFSDIVNEMMDTLGDDGVRQIADSLGVNFITALYDAGNTVDLFVSRVNAGETHLAGFDSGLLKVANAAEFFRKEQAKVNERLDELRRLDMGRALNSFMRALNAKDVDRASEALDRYISTGEELYKNLPASMSSFYEDAVNMAEELAKIEEEAYDEEIRLGLNEGDKELILKFFDIIRDKIAGISDEFKGFINITDESLKTSAMGKFIQDHMGGFGPEFMMTIDGQDSVSRHLGEIDRNLATLLRYYKEYSGLGSLELEGGKAGDVITGVADELDGIKDVMEGIETATGKVAEGVANATKIFELSPLAKDDYYNEIIRNFHRMRHNLVKIEASLNSRDEQLAARGGAVRARSPMMDAAISSLIEGVESIGETFDKVFSGIIGPEFTKQNAEAYKDYVKAIDEVMKTYRDSIDDTTRSLVRNESTYLDYVNNIIDAEKQKHQEMMDAQEEYRESLKKTREVIQEQFEDLLDTLLDSGKISTFVEAMMASISGSSGLDFNLDKMIGAGDEIRQSIVGVFDNVVKGIMSKRTIDDLREDVKIQLLKDVEGAYDIGSVITQEVLDRLPTRAFIKSDFLLKLTDITKGMTDAFGSVLMTMTSSMLGPIIGGIAEVIKMTMADDAHLLVREFNRFVRELPLAIERFVRDFSKNFSQMISAISDNMPHIVSTIVAALPVIFSNIIDNLRSELPGIVQAIAGGLPDFVSSLVGFILDLVIVVIEQIPALVGGLSEAFVKGVETILPKLLDLVATVIVVVFESVIAMIGGLLSSGPMGGIVGIVTLFIALYKIIFGATEKTLTASEVMMQAGETLMNAGIELRQAAAELFGASRSQSATAKEGSASASILGSGAAGLIAGAGAVLNVISTLVDEEVSKGEKWGVAIGTLIGGAIGGVLAGVLSLGVGIPAGIAIGASVGGMAGRSLGKRFHTGGYIGSAAKGLSYAGLRADEVPIIAQTGEGVLSRQGMRALGGVHMLNAINRGVNVFSNMSKYSNAERFHKGGVIGQGYSAKPVNTNNNSDNSINITLNIGSAGENRAQNRRMVRDLAQQIDREIGRNIRDRNSRIRSEMNR